MQLNYWPVTRTSYDVCNRTGGTITENPRTAVISGTTITTPDVALVFTSLYAYDQCGHIGSDMSKVVFTIPASDISSAGNAGIHVIANSWSMNYGDLLPNHVPSSAWFNQPECYSESIWSSSMINATGTAWISSFGQQFPECGTIWEANYQPLLAAPTQLLDLQPEWKSCTALFGLYDPPIALQPAASAAGVTVPGGVAPTTAPVPSPTANVPQQTAGPSVVDGPTTPAAQSTPEPSVNQQPTALPDQVSSASPNEPNQSDNESPLNGPSKPVQPSAAASENPQPNGASNAPSAITVVQGQSGQPVTVAQQGSSVIVVAGGSTAAVAPGASVTVAGQQVAVPESGSNVVVGAQTVALLPAPNNSPAAILTVAPQVPSHPMTISQQGSSVVVENGGQVTTLTPGQQAVVNGQTVSVPTSGGGLVVGSSSMVLGNSGGPQSTILTLGSDPVNQAVTAVQQGSSVIVENNGQTTTLAPGQQAVINGQVVSAPTSGRGLMVGASSVALGSSQSTVLTFGPGFTNQAATFVRDGSSVIVENGNSATTLAPGQQAVIFGQTVSVPVSGGDLVVGTSTLSLGDNGATPSTVLTFGQPGITSPATIYQDGSSVVISEGGSAVTLAPGSQATFEGQIVSLDSSDGVLVLGSSRVPLLNQGAAAFVTAPSGQIVEVEQQGSNVIVADGSKTYTLSEGVQTVIDGETISVPSSSGMVIVHGSTVSLVASTRSSGPTTTTATTTASSGGSVSPVVQPAASTSKKGDASSLRTLDIGAWGVVLLCGLACTLWL